jgi:glycyl-tRNA synthetase
MSFIIKKKLKSGDYYYLRETRREGKKVISRDIAYLGTSRKDAEKKAKEFKNNPLGKNMKGVRITYFVHGTTLDNEKDISSGWKDVELSEKGIRQSNELPKQIGNKKFDAIFSSDLKRAVRSAEISFGKKYLVIQDKRLRECDYGDFNGKASSVVEPMQEKSIQTRFPNGESYGDVKKRIAEFLNYLYKNYSGKHIAIVAHKAPQLAIEVLLKGKSWEQVFADDWRKKKAWQPGWEYFINPEIKDDIMVKEEIKDEQSEPIRETKLTIDELAAFCKRKGFVFKSSEIYGGMSGFWDFGPLGVELFGNIKREFWKNFVQEKENMVGIEASIISHPRVWKASGHISNFNDVSVRCKKCKKYNKVDREELESAKCGFCGGELDKTTAKDLNLMFKTQIGPVEEESMLSYLRPETAQGMFSDFRLVQETSRKQLPFGIVQIGKCFRNEIAPRDFLFRSREFHIGEFEFFIHPDEKKCELLDSEHLNVKIKFLDAETQVAGKSDLRETSIGKILKEGRLEEWHAYWLAEQILWFKKLGLADKIKIREHMKTELSHYSSATFDMDYEYPFGSKEVAGNANRGSFDLTQHMKESGQKLDIFDEKTKSRVIPRVIEPTFGVERIFLALLCQGYVFDEKRQNIVLKLPAFLAPVKAAIFPIVKTDDKLVKISREVYSELRKEWNVVYDESGSVGRRYSRNDESGTPYCITFDEDSMKNKDCTIRDRDSTKQIRVKVENLRETLRKLINSEIEFEKAGKLVETRVKED